MFGPECLLTRHQWDLLVQFAVSAEGLPYYQDPQNKVTPVFFFQCTLNEIE